MHSISFEDDVWFDCCCYCLGIVMLLNDMLFHTIATKRTTKPTAGSNCFCVNWRRCKICPV